MPAKASVTIRYNAAEHKWVVRCSCNKWENRYLLEENAKTAREGHLRTIHGQRDF